LRSRPITRGEDTELAGSVPMGMIPDEVAGHSLRAGLATSAASAGVPERVIAEQTGHRGTAMLRRYVREGSLFRENAASAVGL
jgi:integrase